MTDNRFTQQLVVSLLDGARFANALRRNGRPCRIKLPEDTDSRAALVDAHLRGAAGELTFIADGHGPWTECVDAVVLAALCPGGDGRCRWVALDLDGDDHGQSGLADPAHATRIIAERADNAGLLPGLLVARSRGGRGRHVFLILPEPVELTDAVIGVAALVASAFRAAVRDVQDGELPHAFRCATGAIANPGAAGVVELIPRSTTRPTYGWALTLPASGAFRAHGGGVIVDPFGDTPVELKYVPRCDANAWRTFVEEHRHILRESQRRHRQRASWHPVAPGTPRLHPLTEEFLEGKSSEGRRNASAFAAACNLLGSGLPLVEVERLIVEGARRCELPEREVHRVVQSAMRAVRSAS